MAEKTDPRNITDTGGQGAERDVSASVPREQRTSPGAGLSDFAASAIGMGLVLNGGARSAAASTPSEVSEEAETEGTDRAAQNGVTPATGEPGANGAPEGQQGANDNESPEGEEGEQEQLSDLPPPSGGTAAGGMTANVRNAGLVSGQIFEEKAAQEEDSEASNEEATEAPTVDIIAGADGLLQPILGEDGLLDDLLDLLLDEGGLLDSILGDDGLVDTVIDTILGTDGILDGLVGEDGLLDVDAVVDELLGEDGILTDIVGDILGDGGLLGGVIDVVLGEDGLISEIGVLDPLVGEDGLVGHLLEPVLGADGLLDDAVGNLIGEDGIIDELVADVPLLDPLLGSDGLVGQVLDVEDGLIGTVVGGLLGGGAPEDPQKAAQGESTDGAGDDDAFLENLLAMPTNEDPGAEGLVLDGLLGEEDVFGFEVAPFDVVGDAVDDLYAGLTGDGGLTGAVVDSGLLSGQVEVDDAEVDALLSDILGPSTADAVAGGDALAILLSDIAEEGESTSEDGAANIFGLNEDGLLDDAPAAVLDGALGEGVQLIDGLFSDETDQA